jgi:antitoxin PrlF
MSDATVTSKGQVTIPAKVRAALGVETGDRIEFVEIERGQFAVVAATGTVRKLKGLIPKPPVAVSIQEMKQAIAARAATRREAGSE